MKKRRDIQGLRALAIAYVVLFHANLSFPGGFTGVDVFFVVSGFVITGTLLGELNRNGRLSLGGFYLRRARRILPAPAVMLVFVALAGILLDPAGTQHMAALTGIAASGLVANFYLYTLHSGYFDVSTQLNPLLHTWMLSVIAQIYIVFPLLLLAGWRLDHSRLGRSHRRQWTWTVIAGASALSFLLSLALSRGYFHSGVGGYQKLVFYSSPTRAWEFGAGALLMLALPLLERLPAWCAIALDLAGATAVGLSAFFVHELGFNEISALLPVGGACLLIAGGTRAPFGVSRLLSLRPMVWFGDISYSVYLWHWPLIVFAKALWPNLSWAVPVAAAVSLLTAWLTYRFVENPIRSRARPGSRSPLAWRTAVALVATCVAIPVVANVGLLQAQKALGATAAMKSWKRAEVMHAYTGRGCGSWVPLGKRHNPRCTLSVSHPRGEIVLLGDSNAAHFAEPVVLAGNRLHYNVTIAAPSSCPYLGLRLKRADGENKLCPPFGSESLTYLSRSRPNLVVLATRTDFYLQNPADGLGVVGKGGLTFDDKAKARLWRRTLGAELSALNKARVPVLLFNPVPVLPTDPSTCAVVRVLTGTCSGSLSRSSVDRWLSLAIKTERGAAATAPKTWVLNFENQLCGKNRCSTARGGITLYRDSRHLSVDGALSLTGTIQRAIAVHARRGK